jgi:hypothetical protein
MVTLYAGSPMSVALSFADTTVAFGLLGGCLGAAVSIGNSHYLKRRFRVVETLKTGALIGFAGCTGGAMAATLFHALEGSALLHIAVWALTGGLIGAGFGWRMGNRSPWTEIIGGASGGIIGGIFSVALTVGWEMAEIVSRLAAFASIGFFIPFGLFAAQTLFQTAGAQAAARPPRFSLRLSTGKILSLVDGVKLGTSDIPGLQAPAGSSTVAEVGRNPNDPNVLGLKNLSRSTWTAEVGNQNRLQVAPGRNLRIAAGTKISFGSVNAEIH